MKEWLSLYESKSGERGIFNRIAAQTQASKWKRRDPDLSYGTNPCSEIILRDKQFCNLTEVIVRQGDKEEDLVSLKVNTSNLDTNYPTNVVRDKFMMSMRHPHHYLPLIKHSQKKQ